MTPKTQELKICWRARDRDKKGHCIFRAKEEMDFYHKYGPPFLVNRCYTKEQAETKIRYIKWMDHVGLVHSSDSYGLSSLKRKRPINERFTIPPGFDHTTKWRRLGKGYPVLILTEPYDVPLREAISSEWDFIRNEKQLEYKIYPPSTRSLWYQDGPGHGSNMAFWWSPAHFKFDEEKVMGHTPFDELEIFYKDG